MSVLRPTNAQAQWRRSARLKNIGRKALADINSRRAEIPVCGAKTKKTGGPCSQPGLENGRCRVHGGLTPKGDQWHQPRWPPRDGAKAEKKLNRKLADLEKRRKAREARKAAMTPEERARYEDWHRRHKPGDAAVRAAACVEIKSNRELGEYLAHPEKPPSPEAQALADAVERLERLQARLDAESGRIQAENNDLGIFA